MIDKDEKSSGIRYLEKFSARDISSAGDTHAYFPLSSKVYF